MIVEKTETFDKWLRTLKDEKCANNTIVFVLRGGRKADQKRDIKQAKKQAKGN